MLTMARVYPNARRRRRAGGAAKDFVNHFCILVDIDPDACQNNRLANAVALRIPWNNAEKDVVPPTVQVNKLWPVVAKLRNAYKKMSDHRFVFRNTSDLNLLAGRAMDVAKQRAEELRGKPLITPLWIPLIRHGALSIVVPTTNLWRIPSQPLPLRFREPTTVQYGHKNAIANGTSKVMPLYNAKSAQKFGWRFPVHSWKRRVPTSKVFGSLDGCILHSYFVRPGGLVLSSGFGTTASKLLLLGTALSIWI
jgi:hypothetical protein